MWQGEGGCVHFKLSFGKCFKPTCPLDLQPHYCTCTASPTQAVIHSSLCPVQRASRHMSLLALHSWFTTFGNYWDWKVEPNSAFPFLSEEAAVSHGTVLDQEEHALPNMPPVSSLWESPLAIFALCKTQTELKPCQPRCPPVSLLHKHAVVAFRQSPPATLCWNCTGKSLNGTPTIHVLDPYQHLHTMQWVQTTEESSPSHAPARNTLLHFIWALLGEYTLPTNAISE